jgi:hypothetical protein
VLLQGAAVTPLTNICISSNELCTARPSQSGSSAGDAGAFIGCNCTSFLRLLLHLSMFAAHAAAYLAPRLPQDQPKQQC